MTRVLLVHAIAILFFYCLLLFIVDIWSSGCVFAEMILGERLFDSVDETSQLSRIFQLFGTPDTSGQPTITSASKEEEEEKEESKGGGTREATLTNPTFRSFISSLTSSSSSGGGSLDSNPSSLFAQYHLNEWEEDLPLTFQSRSPNTAAFVRLIQSYFE